MLVPAPRRWHTFCIGAEQLEGEGMGMGMGLPVP